VRESALSVHACFLIKSMSQRDEPVRDVSVKLLTQLKEKFPQVRCFDLSSNAVVVLF
jgi:phosphatidylinositol 4-kinase